MFCFVVESLFFTNCFIHSVECFRQHLKLQISFSFYFCFISVKETAIRQPYLSPHIVFRFVVTLIRVFRTHKWAPQCTFVNCAFNVRCAGCAERLQDDGLPVESHRQERPLLPSGRQREEVGPFVNYFCGWLFRCFG